MLNNKEIDLAVIQGLLTETATLIYRKQLTSTNTVLQDEIKQGLHSSKNSPIVLIAETQTAGRGQQGKKWCTPYGQTICMSFHRCFENKKPYDLQGLSLVVGIAVLEALRFEDPENLLGLKWPNDILGRTRSGYAKLGGILVETWQEGHQTHAVIGIGVTCTQKETIVASCFESDGNALSNITQPWQDLETLLGRAINRSATIASIINILSNKLNLFALKGFAPFRNSWEKYDLFKGLKKNYLIDKKPVLGTIIGVSERGELLFDDGKKINFIRNGISLLKNGVKPGNIPGVLA